MWLHVQALFIILIAYLPNMFSTNIIVLICILKGYLLKTEHFIKVIPAESKETLKSFNNCLQYITN